MTRWKRGLLWIGAGALLAVGPLVANALAGGDDEESKGVRLALFVILFSATIIGGLVAMVRGVLILMEHVQRRRAVAILGITVAGMIIAVILHNVVYAVTGTEEGFFFILALFVGPLILVAAIIRAFRPAGRDDRPLGYQGPKPRFPGTTPQPPATRP